MMTLKNTPQSIHHKCLLLSLLTMGLIFFHGVAFAAESNPYLIAKEMRQKRQALRVDIPLAITFGMGMVSSTRPTAQTPSICGDIEGDLCPEEGEEYYEQFNSSKSKPGVLSIQLEIYAKPKTSLLLGWSTAGDAANLIHLSARQGFGKAPHSVLFLEGGLTYGRAKNFGFIGLPAGRRIVGIGPRLAVGYKRQLGNRFVIEVGAGLSASVYTKWTRTDAIIGNGSPDEHRMNGECHDQDCVETVAIDHPMLLIPEFNIRLGWRLHGPKTRPQKNSNRR